MPSEFQLTNKKTQEVAKLDDVDREIAKHFGYSQNPDGTYFASWYNVIGYHLSMRRNWQEIREEIDWLFETRPEQSDLKTMLINISKFLEEKYEPFGTGKFI